ncbi:hypothetical protein PspLS_02931 [Pyricularia sp. CBS 133598]|nr:hypothetical protein PspLS_02931 [Pyricularia sp. CBS 133598]
MNIVHCGQLLARVLSLRVKLTLIEHNSGDLEAQNREDGLYKIVGKSIRVVEYLVPVENIGENAELL